MSLPEEHEDVDQATKDFMLKVMNKCATYRNEVAKEKCKRNELREEIARDFGNTDSVLAVVSEFENQK